MKLNDIAFNNLRRRKGKTLFLLLTFFLVVGTSVASNAISSSLKTELDKQSSSYGANIVISPKSEQLNLSYGGLALPSVTYNVQTLSADALQSIRQIKDYAMITGVAPKVVGLAESNQQKYLLVGVDFSAELAMKSSWKIDGALPGADEVVLGSRLAERENITQGNLLNFAGNQVKVSGVMEETGSSVDQSVLGNLELIETILNTGHAYNLVELNASNPERVAEELNVVLPDVRVALVAEHVQGASESSGRFLSFARYITILMALIGSLVVAVTMTGNINDRVSELGTLLSIGFRQRHVLKILLIEVLCISMAGGLIGYIAGITAPVFIGVIVTGQTLSFAFYPLMGMTSILVAGVVGVAAAAYPIWRVTGLDPSEVLRLI